MNGMEGNSKQAAPKMLGGKRQQATHECTREFHFACVDAADLRRIERA
ncbi:hypothetical protein [Nocardia anaemiae]|nr:hypothetical protein [Nocardia anaemiae]